MSRVFLDLARKQLSIVGNTDLPWLVEILPLCEEKNKLLYISIQVCLAHCIELISCYIHIRQNSKNQKVWCNNLYTNSGNKGVGNLGPWWKSDTHVDFFQLIRPSDKAMVNSQQKEHSFWLLLLLVHESTMICNSLYQGLSMQDGLFQFSKKICKFYLLTINLE